ncbi:hypothetical protein [Desulfosporosinus nitroreducens]|uniref:Uncharacterized protein n=1 Tax=Desulfosporosinus nitroreducens TaxID=2018668 RepID=A0ABT8QKC6_9FIRM|nr:hypothetical protein [Desulfosporosinus nitroreducens]MDO0821741.1 hypothetical protein [Desulfosporosinus nitroreducens]
MVWPRRKIQLVASSAAPGIGGVRAVLKGIQLDFSEVEPTKEDLSQEFAGDWIELPFELNPNSGPDKFSPVTELVYWPEKHEHDYWREKALAQGIEQRSVQSLIHSLFEDELIIWVSEPTVLIQERPLLAHILNEAGFEPTVLWPTVDGRWQCERKQGLHWLLPESWLEGLMEKSSLGRETAWDEGKEKASWVVRENRIDFYRSQDGQKFAGHLPRWPKLSEEQTAAQNIAMCIDLGVSWFDISLALSSIWKNIRMADNLRWNINDFEWNAGACGEELSATSIEHMEDWWAR